MIENQLKVGQWSVTPCKGTIAPDSQVTVEVEFNGSGQKLFEQKFGIDVSCRDPDDEPKGILYETVGESCIPGINCENYESIFEEQIIVASQSANQNITAMINSNVFFSEEKTFFFGTLVPQQHPDGIFERFKITNPNKVRTDRHAVDRLTDNLLADRMHSEVRGEEAECDSNRTVRVRNRSEDCENPPT